MPNERLWKKHTHMFSSGFNEAGTDSLPIGDIAIKRERKTKIFWLFAVIDCIVLIISLLDSSTTLWIRLTW